MGNTQVIHVVCERSSHFFGKQGRQITGVYTQIAGKGFQGQVSAQVCFYVGNHSSDKRRVGFVLVFFYNLAVAKDNFPLGCQALLHRGELFQHGDIAVGIRIYVDRMHAGFFCCFSKEGVVDLINYQNTDLLACL